MKSMLVQQIKDEMVKKLDPEDIVDLLGVDSQTLVDKFDSIIEEDWSTILDALDLHLEIPEDDDEMVEEPEHWDK